VSVEELGGTSRFSGGGARTEFLSIRREASVPYEKAWLQKIRNDGFRYAVWEGRTQINCLGVTWLRSATLLSRGTTAGSGVSIHGIHRGARGRVFPDRPPSHRPVAFSPSRTSELSAYPPRAPDHVAG